MVFDVIVGPEIKRKIPSLKAFGHGFPFVSSSAVNIEKLGLLLVSPGFFINIGVEVVIPSFTALFACPFANIILFLKFFRDIGPIIGA